MITILALAATYVDTTPRVIQQRDAMSDRLNTYVILGDPERHVAMGCEITDTRKVRVSIKTGHYLGRIKPGFFAEPSIQWRIDDHIPETAHWQRDGEQIAAEFETDKPMSFIRKMKESTRLLVRVWNDGYGSYDMGFSYWGITGPIDVMLDRCGFDRDGNPKK